MGLDTAYVVVEGVAGFLTGSLALIADAGHHLTDVAGLLIARGAAVLAKRAGNAAYTFGYGRATILAAMLNAVAILIGVVVVVWEAAQRFQTVVEVPGLKILLVALIGIGVNPKNALFAGHDAAAENWAVIDSLIETCKMNGVDPQVRLSATLKAIVQGHKQSQIDELLPWNDPVTV